jgi:O-antigen biosynthesis protein
MTRIELPPDFDAEAYLRLNDDVRRMRVDPVEHYLQQGRSEGRTWIEPILPEDFDPEGYLRLNKDVAKSGLDATTHYRLHGQREGRRWKEEDPLELAENGASQSELVSEYWATERKGDCPVSWLEHPSVRALAQRRISGDPTTGSIGWFRRQYVPKALDLCLSLGCGFGAFERLAIESGLTKTIHASDISSGAIDKARQAAADANLADKIVYEVIDLDAPDFTLPHALYDVIFGLASVHHVSQLENLFGQCAAALKPGGLLFLDEYIGPNRFQSPPHVVELINKIRSALPQRYRRNLFTNDLSIMGHYVPSPVEHFERTDPSEAIRSADILTALQLHFDVVEMRPYGGAIQHMLFSGIVGNFMEDNESDVALLRIIAILEEELERAGAIDTEFAAIVARPKDA